MTTPHAIPEQWATMLLDRENNDAECLLRSSSLVESVATAISCTPGGSNAEAQAAIHAVAAWLREHTLPT